MSRKRQNGSLLGKKRIYYDGNSTGVHDTQTVYDNFSGAPTNREGFNRGRGYANNIYTMSFPFTFGYGAPSTQIITTSSPRAQAQFLAEYQSSAPSDYANWISGLTYWTYSLGKQTWTVPETASYIFTVRGAGGGGGGQYNTSAGISPGKGAIVTFTASLIAGDQVTIAVGHVGTSGSSTSSCGGGSGGGGGASWVYDVTNSQLMCVAGGGAGAGNDNFIDVAADHQPDARINTTTGGNAIGTSTVPGGQNGNGGTTATTTHGCVNGGGGGGGFLTDGSTGGASNQGDGGHSWTTSTNPLYGGTLYRAGGFGGGGSSGNYCGGGGGGYSGGAGGGLRTCSCSNLSGGGGGSCFVYGSATNVTQAVDTINFRMGQVVVDIVP